MHAVATITPADYARRKNEANPPVLIDVREPWEFGYARIEGARLMPLGGITDWAKTLDKEAPYVVVCHHGVRSESACRFLLGLGFKNVINLEGGIEAWSRLVDPAVPRY